MDLSDKLIDYISQLKSPFEEENGISQQELEWDGYIKYTRDCMIQSIGTKDSRNLFNLYLNQFKQSSTDDQYHQFIDNCINRLINKYKMSYLSFMIQQNDIDSDTKEELIKFIEFKKWLDVFVKCLSKIDLKIYKNDAKLKIFLSSVLSIVHPSKVYLKLYSYIITLFKRIFKNFLSDFILKDCFYRFFTKKSRK